MTDNQVECLAVLVDEIMDDQVKAEVERLDYGGRQEYYNKKHREIQARMTPPEFLEVCSLIQRIFRHHV